MTGSCGAAVTLKELKGGACNFEILDLNSCWVYHSDQATVPKSNRESNGNV